MLTGLLRRVVEGAPEFIVVVAAGAARSVLVAVPLGK